MCSRPVRPCSAGCALAGTLGARAFRAPAVALVLPRAGIAVLFGAWYPPRQQNQIISSGATAVRVLVFGAANINLRILYLVRYRQIATNFQLPPRLQQTVGIFSNDFGS